MHRWLPACLALACGAALVAGICSAQSPGGKKEEVLKGKDKDAAQEKEKPSLDKEKPSLEKLRLPPGSIVVLVEELKEAMKLFPRVAVMSLEEYQELQERLARLEKQLKSDRKAAHACKLTGKLEGDFVTLRAEFAFTTDTPRSSVLLGLQGAYLTDEGDLDRTVPVLDYGDDGYVVRVEKEGTHQLVLNLKTAVGLKRGTAPGGGAERGFDLGLPGAAVTTLTLELPPGVKEVRWNENLEKQRSQNRWELALGKVKNLSMSWKEPVALPGQGPLLIVDGQITLKLDEAHAALMAELTLEDLRGQASEWRLLLPSNAHVDIKAPPGMSVELIQPDAKNPHHVLKLKEPSTERLVVVVQARYVRPFATPKLAVGPFAVPGAYRQQGTITVQAPPEALRGQRLIYHRHGEIYQRDLPKNAAADVLASFQYWSLEAGKTSKGPALVPLEVESKIDKGSLEARVDHELRVRSGTGAWVIEATSRFRIKTPQAGAEGIDIQLPRWRPTGLEVFAAHVGVPFPATLSWSGLRSAEFSAGALALPLDFFCDDSPGFELSPPDGQRRARLKLTRAPARDFIVTLTGKYLVPAAARRATLELPRLLGALDRGGKVTVRAEDGIDLLVGPSGSESPAADPHQVHMIWEQSPTMADLAWAVHRPQLVVTATADVTVRERFAEVRQQIAVVLPGPGVRTGVAAGGQLRLHVPSAVQNLAVRSGGRLTNHDRERETAHLVVEGDKIELLLEYDFALPRKADPEAANSTARLMQVSLIRIEGATRQGAKVRVWTEQGTFPLLAEQTGVEAWKERGGESVVDRDSLPALVVEAAETPAPLMLRLLEAVPHRLALFLGGRGLIQVAVDEDGNQTYRARFLIRKLNTRQLEIDLPLPVAACQPQIRLDHKKVAWFPVEPNWKRLHVPVDPALYAGPLVVEIEYQLPASVSDPQRHYVTRLSPPVFPGEVLMGQIRWQVSLPDSWVALVGGIDTQADWQWGWQGWLLGPEPAVTSAELENWLTGRDSTEPSWPLTMALWENNQASVTLLHLPRQIWLLACSALVLVGGLALYLAPLSRAVFWLILIAVGLAAAAVCWLWPAWIGPLAMGSQPGLLVLLVILGAYWTVQESYRRQVVFMPGFTRVKPGSSLLRGSGSGNRPREPSTVDAPAEAAPSSASKNVS